MRFFLLLVCICFLQACRKDPALVYDNYINLDGTIYFRSQNSNDPFESTTFPPYYTAVSWTTFSKQRKIAITIGNTCDNNRGRLSNYRGFIDLKLWNGNDSAQYVGGFPLFKLEYLQNKLYIDYNKLKVYRLKTFNYGDLDSTDYKIISGRATF